MKHNLSARKAEKWAKRHNYTRVGNFFFPPETRSADQIRNDDMHKGCFTPKQPVPAFNN